MNILLPIVLVIFTAIILFQHYKSTMKIGEKLILVMILILVLYTAFSYAKLNYITETFNTSISNKKSADNADDADDADNADDTDDADNADNADDVDDLISLNSANKFAELGSPSSSLLTAINYNKSNMEKFNDEQQHETATDLKGIKGVFNPQIYIKSKNKKPLAQEWSQSEDLNAVNFNQVTSNTRYYDNDNSTVDNININKSGIDSRNVDGNKTFDINVNSKQTINSPVEIGGINYNYNSDIEEENNKSGKGFDGNQSNVFPKGKLFYPGYTYIPPTRWDVPQRYTPVCNLPNPDTMKLPIGVMDYGTPINALELNSKGVIAHHEKDVHLTNVGSLMPKFEYKILPYAMP